MNEINPDIHHGRETWSHVCETINMLYLAVCQIEATMSDSNKSVETLTRSFTHLAEHTHDVSRHIQDLQKPEELADLKQDLAVTTTEMHSNISASVQAFQFYDRVCQRLDHVSRSLEKVTQIMADDGKLNNPSSWQQVQRDIKSSYTMEAERVMFEYIMRGGTIKEALDIYRHHFNDSSATDPTTGDEIELF